MEHTHDGTTHNANNVHDAHDARRHALTARGWVQHGPIHAHFVHDGIPVVHVRPHARIHTHTNEHDAHDAQRCNAARCTDRFVRGGYDTHDTYCGWVVTNVRDNVVDGTELIAQWRRNRYAHGGWDALVENA